VLLHVANAPASWGVEDPADPANPLWQDVVREVAAAGYAGIELGPLGFMPEDPEPLRAELARRDLELVAGFLFDRLDAPDAVDTALARARRTCRLLAAAGARHLVVIQGFSPARERSAGRRAEAAPLSGDGWRTMIDGVHAVAEIAADHGLSPCLHPHAGTAVEFEDEIERAIADTDPALVSICIDTGHCAYAGVDPVALYERHAERVTYLHLKDVDDRRLDDALRAGLSFERAVGEGVFCPLGEGMVDFAGLLAALERHGFEGWGTVEQDRLPDDSAAPGAQAAASLAHLRGVGLPA
jgi:inosose dehydratase